MIWPAAHASVAFGWPIGLAPAPEGGGGEIDWILQGPWAKLAILIVVAVAVLTVGNLMMKRRSRAGSGGRARGDFDLEVAKMTELPVTPIARAQAGPVHLEAVLVSASGTLGGAPGRECVWRNRHGASRSTAVGAELVVAQDETGQVGLEGLEHARVLAPKDPGGGKHEFASLYIGDRVEIVGRFSAERYGETEDASQRVYGMLGSDGQFQIKVLERPDSAASEPSPPEPPAGTPDPDPSPKDSDSP